MRPKKYASQCELIPDYIENLLKLKDDKQLESVLDLAKKSGTPPLQMTPHDARHLEVLVKLMQPQKVVEIGTLCGYSTVCLARAIQANGKIYTCEKSEHHIEVAKKVFQELKLEHLIEILEGDALANLPILSKHGPFDVIFIDANKDEYPAYFDWSIENLRKGGLLIADNVFAFEYIAKQPPPPGRLGELVQNVEKFNQKCANHPQLLTTFLPTGEGLMVAVKL